VRGDDRVSSPDVANPQGGDLPMGSRTKAVALRLENLEGRLLLAGAGKAPRAPAVPPPLIDPPTTDPGQVTGVTDPRIIKEGDTFYVFSSGPGILIRASNDLT